VERRNKFKKSKGEIAKHEIKIKNEMRNYEPLIESNLAKDERQNEI